MSAYEPFSDLSAKLLKVLTLSAFETDDHLGEAGAALSSSIEGRSLGGGTLAPESIMIVWEDFLSHFWLSN